MSELTKMQFPEGYQCQYKEKVMKLANMIGRKKADAVPGGEGSYQWDDRNMSAWKRESAMKWRKLHSVSVLSRKRQCLRWRK